MNKSTIISIVLLAVLLTSCGQGAGTGRQASLTSGSGTPEILFTEYEHNFGQVKEGTKVSYLFHFENKGDGNLVIKSATTTCGCTVPSYSKKPIAPGKDGTLEVVFNTSGKHGMQTKTITVSSNAKVPVVILKITADVL